MKAVSIITHRTEVVYSSSVLFILSKGLNAGKPLSKPCPNCFAVSFENSRELERFKSFCTVLFQSRIFRQYLKGSVVPFLSIRDFKSVVANYSGLIEHLPLEFDKLVELLGKIEHQELINRKTLQLLSEYRKCLISDYLKTLKA